MSVTREQLIEASRRAVVVEVSGLGPTAFSALSALAWSERARQISALAKEGEIDALGEAEAALLAETALGADGGPLFADAADVRETCSQALFGALFAAACKAQSGDLEAEKNGSAPTPSSAA